jgi:hypothetical protein
MFWSSAQVCVELLVSMAIGSVVVVAVVSVLELHPSVVELLVLMALGSVIGTPPLLLVDALLPSRSVLELRVLMEFGSVIGTRLLLPTPDALVQSRGVLASPVLMESGLVVTQNQVEPTVQVETQKLQIRIASMPRKDLAQDSRVQTPKCIAVRILEMA